MKVNWQFAARSVLAFVFFAPLAQAQAVSQTPPDPSVCPVQFQNFDPGDTSIRVKNISGKKIVGLVFNAALSDATEHWIWIHWNLDQNRSLRDFSWNREMKPDDSKRITWNVYLAFDHVGGAAMVLSSALFADGTRWEASSDVAACSVLWHNHHKKGFLRAPDFPPLQ
jgi:hypothetical protein